ncbi:unnamed protein product, partial [Closterium sp. NIES-53]
SNGQLEQMEFEFDSVLPPTATQADVYQVAAKPVVADVLNGYNGTVMAYGQTGAGKTYTLSSTKPPHLGIIPRAAAEVFVMARADPTHTYRVSMSYIQIYMEMIQDLLRPSSSNMQIRESENGVYISGVEEVEVTCVEDCLKLLAVGERNRTVAFTKMNAHSSRSHAIAIITVEKKRRKDAESSDSEAHSGPATATAGHGSDEHRKPEKKDKILVGKLFLVDLAGSERLKKSGSEGLRASEAKSVNLSLTVLGKCINARADPHAHHVPFRDSKLTRLLQESLGGNAKTSLVINVAPTVHHLNESLSSLLFGSRAMEVKTKAMVNEEEEYRILTRTLQETIDEHDDRVHSLEVVVYSQEEQLSQAKASLEEQKELVETLQAEREEMEQKLAEGVAAVEEEWAAKLEQAETEARQQMEEAQQTFSEEKQESDCHGYKELDQIQGTERHWMEAIQENGMGEGRDETSDSSGSFSGMLIRQRGESEGSVLSCGDPCGLLKEGAGDAGQELMAEEASKESDSGEKGSEGGREDGEGSGGGEEEGSGDGEEEGSEDWEDGSGVKELLSAFTSVALTHVQNLSKATESLTMERDDMAKELASAREMQRRCSGTKANMTCLLLSILPLSPTLSPTFLASSHPTPLSFPYLSHVCSGAAAGAAAEGGAGGEGAAGGGSAMVQRLEQQLQEAQEAKGQLEEALLIASESGDGADGTGAGLQLLMTEKAARQQAEQEVVSLRGEMSRGRVKLEESEKKLAQQIEETSQRVEQVRALKAESKRLNELVVATSRALVAGAADAAGRALSSLDYHFCAPKIKT